MMAIMSAVAFSQSVLVPVGDAGAIASPFRLSSIQFREDGKTLVGISNENKMTAWTLPEGNPAIPPEKWRLYDAPIGTSYSVDRDYNIVVTLADGRTWMLPHTKTFDQPIGYDEATKRLYYYSPDKGETVKVYSVLEGGKDRKSIATTTKSSLSKLFMADGGKVFSLMTLVSSFTVSDLSNKTIYSGKRLKDNRYSDGRMVEPSIHVSPDGKRMRIDSWGERVVVRMPDGAELLHVNEPYYRVAEDAENRYLGFLDASDKDENDLTSYRVKVFLVPDEPGPVKYMWLAGYPGTELFAADEQRNHKKEQAASAARYQAEKQREAAAAEAAARHSAASQQGSGGGDPNRRVAELIRNATGLISSANSNIRQAIARRDQGERQSNWCVLIWRAKDDINLADRTLTEAAGLYSSLYSNDISKARAGITTMRRDLGIYGCR